MQDREVVVGRVDGASNFQVGVAQVSSVVPKRVAAISSSAQTLLPLDHHHLLQFSVANSPKLLAQGLSANFGHSIDIFVSLLGRRAQPARALKIQDWRITQSDQPLHCGVLNTTYGTGSA